MPLNTTTPSPELSATRSITEGERPTWSVRLDNIGKSDKKDVVLSQTFAVDSEHRCRHTNVPRLADLVVESEALASAVRRSAAAARSASSIPFVGEQVGEHDPSPVTDAAIRDFLLLKQFH